MNDTRAKIIDAATHLFAQKGYEGTSLSMIGEATGLLKGSLVYHFSTKEALRDAVLDSLLSRWKDILPAILIAATTGVNRFDRILGEALDFFLADPDRARLLLRESLDRPEDLLARYETQLQPWVELVAETIETGKRTGEIQRDVDPYAYIWEVVLMILSSVSVIGMAGVIDTSLNDPEEASRRVSAELIRIARRALFAVSEDATGHRSRKRHHHKEE